MLPSLNHFHFPFFPSQGILHNLWEDPADRRMASHSVGTPGPCDLMVTPWVGDSLQGTRKHVLPGWGSWENHRLKKRLFTGDM